MSNVNTVAISGNLTRDPELRTLQSGTSVCDFGIAVNKSKKTDDGYEDETSFFDVTVWSGFGELCAKKLSKGSAVTVQGELKQDRWETEAGDNRSKVKIVARQVDGADFYKKGGEAPAATNETSPPDDDIPF